MTSHETAIEAAKKVFHEELLGTISTDDLNKVISAYLKEMGSEPYAWVRDTGTFITNNEYSQLTEESKQRYSHLFLAPSEDIEKLKAERDEAPAAWPGWIYDPDHHMSDGGDTRMTAAEEVLAYLLVEVNGSPDDVPYSPNDAQRILEDRLKEGRRLESDYGEFLAKRRKAKAAQEEPLDLDTLAYNAGLEIRYAVAASGVDPIQHIPEVDAILLRRFQELASLSDRSVSGDAVRVKPLEWHVWPEDGGRSFEGQNEQRQYLARAMHPWGAFFLMVKDGAFSIDRCAPLEDARFSSAEEAKAGAQSDYESRVRSALVTADRTEDGRDETFTREQVEAHVNKRLEEFSIARQSISASKDELIRELVRALKPFSKLFPDTTFINGVCCKDYDDDKGFFVSDDIPAPTDFHMRDVRSVRSALTLASEAGYNDGGDK